MKMEEKRVARIELKHLFKDYVEGVHAVTDFDLTIENEEFIVLVGPSGCGKSTTLRMIAGLEDITSGEMYIDGKKQSDLHPCNNEAVFFQMDPSQGTVPAFHCHKSLAQKSRLTAPGIFLLVE